MTCQGSISATGSGINLFAGLAISGAASVNLGSGTLSSRDSVSGISGGTLMAAEQTLANTGTGIFTQSAGLNTESILTIGSGGRYLLGGGALQFPPAGSLQNSGTLDGGNSAGAYPSREVPSLTSPREVTFAQGVLR